MATPDRYAPLRAALALHDAEELAPEIHAAIQSAIKAAVPGRQQRGNIAPVMAVALKAFCRTLTRRARARTI